MMIDPYIAIAAASVVGISAGGLIGFFIADGRLKRRYAEIRNEVSRLRKVAEEKLSHDEPDLESLLRNLNTAVQETFKASSALENHEQVVARQHQGGKEIIASSQYIMRMIDELAGEKPEPMEPIQKKLAPNLISESAKHDEDAPLEANLKGKKPPMRKLR